MTDDYIEIIGIPVPYQYKNNFDSLVKLTGFIILEFIAMYCLAGIYHEIFEYFKFPNVSIFWWIVASYAIEYQVGIVGVIIPVLIDVGIHI